MSCTSHTVSLFSAQALANSEEILVGSGASCQVREKPVDIFS